MTPFFWALSTPADPRLLVGGDAAGELILSGENISKSLDLGASSEVPATGAESVENGRQKHRAIHMGVTDTTSDTAR